MSLESAVSEFNIVHEHRKYYKKGN